MIEQTGELPPDDEIDAYVCRMRGATPSHTYLVYTELAIERYQEFRGLTIHFTRPTKPKRLPEEPLSEAEIAVFLGGVKDLRNKALLSLLAYSGIRNAELCALRIQDLDLAGNVVRVVRGKGQRAYIASIAGPCVEVLTRYLAIRKGQPADLLFLTSRNKLALEPQDLRKIVRVAARNAGMERRVHPHLFRHSLAMNLLGRGAHPMTIQKQLGHADIQTTMIYLDHEFKRAHADYDLCAPSYL